MILFNKNYSNHKHNDMNIIHTEFVWKAVITGGFIQ